LVAPGSAASRTPTGIREDQCGYDEIRKVTYVLTRWFRASQFMDLVVDINNRRTSHGLLDKHSRCNGNTTLIRSVQPPKSRPHLTDQVLHNWRIYGIGREGVFCVDDSERAVLFKRCRIVTELVQQNTKCPYVCEKSVRATGLALHSLSVCLLLTCW
jgi:hypothetical protein